MEDCVFCKIVKKEIPAKVIYETDDVIAFKDIAPAAPIHYLVIPKNHVKNLSEAIAYDKGLVDNVMLGITSVAKKLGVEEAYKAVTNNGEGAGQVVPHFHFHLLAGWKDKESALFGMYKEKNDSK